MAPGRVAVGIICCLVYIVGSSNHVSCLRYQSGEFCQTFLLFRMAWSRQSLWCCVIWINDVKLYSLAIALVIMSGVYGVLYLISEGKWIGLGDVKLSVGLGLILASWQSAFVGLFLA